ncbi:hypothetical protein FOF52_17875 [Thermobifida alba]|uniref:Integral membrane protein n=1 Tax=Thermobifida alba TaxID=53522 RepID=A0ABY4L4H6_THEAE|nr:hypothetical protein [Thermobifida alba]UPT22591.1 hypothetical protein FOF52_17875 [Thermobifida alba]
MEREQNTSPQPTPEQTRSSSYYSVLNPWWTTLLIAVFFSAMPLAPVFGVDWVPLALLGGPLLLGLLTWASRQRPDAGMRFGPVESTLLVAGVAVVLAGLLAGSFLADTYGVWVWGTAVAANVTAIVGIDLILRSKARKAA